MKGSKVTELIVRQNIRVARALIGCLHANSANEQKLLSF